MALGGLFPPELVDNATATGCEWNASGADQDHTIGCLGPNVVFGRRVLHLTRSIPHSLTNGHGQAGQLRGDNVGGWSRHTSVLYRSIPLDV